MSLEIDLLVSEKLAIQSLGCSSTPTLQSSSRRLLPPSPAPGPSMVQVRRNVVLTWSATCFVLCVLYAVMCFLQMANIDEFSFLAKGFDQEEEMDVGGPVDPGIINIQTSESKQEDLGEDLEDESSVHESSSDSPAMQVVPSVGSVGGQTGLSVPQPLGQVLPTMHTSSSASNTHNVGTFTSAGLRDSAGPPLVDLQCSAHSTTWQPGCAVCDVALVHASKAPVIDPKLVVTERLLGHITNRPTHAVELGVVGLKVAQHICHQQRPMAAKEASYEKFFQAKTATS